MQFIALYYIFFVVVPRLESSLVAALLSPLPQVAPPQLVLKFVIKHGCRISDIISCGPRASEGERVSARSKKFSRGAATRLARLEGKIRFIYRDCIRIRYPF